jgi:hypothetical protein
MLARLLLGPNQPPSIRSHNESRWLLRAAKIVGRGIDVPEKFMITHLVPRRMYGAISTLGTTVL